MLFLDLEASGLVAPVIDDLSEIVSLSCGYTKKSKAWRFFRQKRLADSQFRWLLETGEDFMVPSQLDMQDDTEEVIT